MPGIILSKNGVDELMSHKLFDHDTDPWENQNRLIKRNTMKLSNTIMKN